MAKLEDLEKKKSSKPTRPKEEAKKPQTKLNPLFLAAAFTFAAGMGGMGYSSYEKTNSLSESYATANVCEQKKEKKQVCTKEEFKAVVEVEGNEKIYELSSSATFGAALLGILFVPVRIRA
jgi:hypothetical protein